MSSPLFQEAAFIDASDTWHAIYGVSEPSDELDRAISEILANSMSLRQCHASFVERIDPTTPYVLLHCSPAVLEVIGSSESTVLVVREGEVHFVDARAGTLVSERVRIGDRVVYSPDDFRPYFSDEKLLELIDGAGPNDVDALSSVAQIRGFESALAGIEVGSLQEWGYTDDAEVTFDGLLAGLDALIETSEVFTSDALDAFAALDAELVEKQRQKEAAPSAVPVDDPLGRLVSAVRVHRKRLIQATSPSELADQQAQWNATLSSLGEDLDGAVAAQVADVGQLMSALIDHRLHIVGLTRRAELARSQTAQLDRAGHAQRLLLPEQSSYEDDAIAYTVHYTSADEAGGDFWTAHRLPDGRWLFLVGDVTGHGVAASLFTGVVRGAVEVARTGLGRGLTAAGLARILALVMRRSGRREYFMTSSIFTLDPTTGTLDMVSAGHVPPLLVRDGEAKFVSVAADPPLGVKVRLEYTSTELQLEPGACLVICTDGVTERINAAGKEYGASRLVAAARTGKYACDIAGAIHRDLQDFAAGEVLADDLTLLVVQRR